MDSNPLLVLLASRLCEGERLPFVEFPIAPRSSHDVAIHHQIEPPTRQGNLTFCLADALRAPFAAGQFDAVLTHWMVDVIDAPLLVLANEVNRLLKQDGLWLNQGSWAFSQADPQNNLSVDEAKWLLEGNGFTVGSVTSHYAPYNERTTQQTPSTRGTGELAVKQAQR